MHSYTDNEVDNYGFKYLLMWRNHVALQSSAKARKSILKLTDDWEHMLLIDPNNKQTPK